MLNNIFKTKYDKKVHWFLKGKNLLQKFKKKPKKTCKSIYILQMTTKSLLKFLIFILKKISH